MNIFIFIALLPLFFIGFSILIVAFGGLIFRVFVLPYFFLQKYGTQIISLLGIGFIIYLFQRLFP